MEEIRKQQEQIMMPGIFQHMGKMGAMGIDPPSFEEDDDEEEEDFAKSRREQKQGGRSRSSSKSKKQQQDIPSDDDDDEDIDLFSAPMNSEAFMAKIREHQN